MSPFLNIGHTEIVEIYVLGIISFIAIATESVTKKPITRNLYAMYGTLSLINAAIFQASGYFNHDINEMTVEAIKASMVLTVTLLTESLFFLTLSVFKKILKTTTQVTFWLLKPILKTKPIATLVAPIVKQFWYVSVDITKELYSLHEKVQRIIE